MKAAFYFAYFLLLSVKLVKLVGADRGRRAVIQSAVALFIAILALNDRGADLRCVLMAFVVAGVSCPLCQVIQQ